MWTNILYCSAETDTTDLRDRLISGYGRVSKGCKGLRLQYYVSPFSLLDEESDEKSMWDPYGWR